MYTLNALAIELQVSPDEVLRLLAKITDTGVLRLRLRNGESLTAAEGRRWIDACRAVRQN